MQTVRRGISLIYWGIILMVLTAIVAFVGAIALGVNLQNPAGLPDAQSAALFLILIGAAFFAGYVMTFVGKIMCLAVPGEVGASGLIFTSVGIDVVALLVTVAGFLTDVPDEVTSLLNLAGLVSTILFLLFLRRLAAYIRRDDLARRARNVLIIGGLLFVMAALTATTALARLEAAAALGLVFAVMLLVGFVMYVNLLGSLKEALKDVYAIVTGAAGAAQCWRCGESLQPGQATCPVCGAWAS